MILVRDVFRLKFGKAREALAAWKAMGEHAKRANPGGGARRLLTDLVGPYYTLVMESTFQDLATYERLLSSMMNDAEWRKTYQTFTPLVESGYREIFTIHEV